MWAKIRSWLIRKLVICCKDCAESREKDMFGVCRVLECGRTETPTQSEGYCAWAVRRERDE